MYTDGSERDARRVVQKINRLTKKADHQGVVKLWHQSGALNPLKFLGLLPDHRCIRAQYQICQALFYLKQDVDARRLAIGILDLKPVHPGAVRLCLQSYLRQRELSEALTFLENRVDEVFPPEDYLSERMELLWRLGKTNQHRDWLPDAIQLCNWNAKATIKLAVHLEKIGFTKDSRDIVQGFLRNFSADAQSLVFAIRQFSRLDTYDIPFVMAKRLNSLSPHLLKNLAFYEESRAITEMVRLSGHAIEERIRSGRAVFRTELVSKLAVELADQPALDSNRSKPKIAFVISSLRRGGAERQLVNTIRAACDQIDDFEGLFLFCGGETQSQKNNTYHPEIPLEFVNIVPTLANRSSGSFVPEEYERGAVWEKITRLLPPSMRKRVEYLAEEFESKNISTVHAWLDGTNIPCCIAALLAKVPKVVLSARGIAPERHGGNLHLQPYHAQAEMWRGCYRYLLRHPSVTLTHNSLAGLKSYEKWLGVTDSAMPVIYNGVDRNAFDSVTDHKVSPEVAALKRSLQGSIVIGSTSRFAAVKRPHFWIQTANHILQSVPDCKFLLVGDGPLLESSIALTKDLGIRDSFVFTQEKSSVRPYLELMNLFLMTSAREGLSNALIEAQLVGIPAVATAVGGVPEVVVNDETGRLVPHFASAEDVADTVVWCIGNRKWMRDTAMNAKRRALEKFDMASSYRQWRMLYS